MASATTPWMPQSDSPFMGLVEIPKGPTDPAAAEHHANTPSPQRLASTPETLVGRDGRPPGSMVPFAIHGNHSSSQTGRDIPELELILRACPGSKPCVV